MIFGAMGENKQVCKKLSQGGSEGLGEMSV